jgi:hypothetical protein
MWCLMQQQNVHLFNPCMFDGLIECQIHWIGMKIASKLYWWNHYYYAEVSFSYPCVPFDHFHTCSHKDSTFISFSRNMIL